MDIGYFYSRFLNRPRSWLALEHLIAARRATDAETGPNFE